MNEENKESLFYEKVVVHFKIIFCLTEFLEIKMQKHDVLCSVFIEITALDACETEIYKVLIFAAY